jgi:hypothetical protein
MMVNLDDELFIDPTHNHSFIVVCFSKNVKPYLSRRNLPCSKNMFKEQYLNTVSFIYKGVEYSLGDLL